jgi:hypothetical protein
VLEPETEKRTAGRKKVRALPTLLAPPRLGAGFVPAGVLARGVLRMGRMRLRGPAVKWVLLALGLLTTSCAGVVGAGAAVVVVGAGVLSMACYDRMTITVTDQATGTKLCDAKVTFTEGSSVTEATSCYSAALSTGKYKLRVERKGLVTYEEPVEVDTGSKCRHAVQTIYVAMDRPNRQTAPQVVAPPPAAPAAAAVAAPAAPPPAPSVSAAPPPAAAPAPAGTAFPDAP